MAFTRHCPHRYLDCSDSTWGSDGKVISPRSSVSDSTTFVVNKQVGDFRLGEPEAEIGYTYGQDCISGCPGVSDGDIPGMKIYRSRLHGGTFESATTPNVSST